MSPAAGPSLTLIALQGQTIRFAALRRTIGGVSDRMLTQTLQTLEADGFVHRQAFPVVPPHVEYSLTPMGEEVAQHVRVLADWIEDNTSTILSTRKEIFGGIEQALLELHTCDNQPMPRTRAFRLC
jgi:DNA-binding HxlR family transcriptional regulator